MNSALKLVHQPFKCIHLKADETTLKPTKQQLNSFQQNLTLVDS